MPLNTLQDIRTKVRRLTQSVSPSQLSDADIDNYVNTFVLYDFPEHLRTFNLRKQFTFFTNPTQDTYATDEASFAGATTNPLYNFQNLIITLHPPVYIAGYEVMMSQNREEFFNCWPFRNSIQRIGTGDGITTTFTGRLPSQGYITPNPNVQNFRSGYLQNQVMFNSIDTGGIGVSLVDVPVVDTVTGYNGQIGNLYTPGFLPSPTNPPYPPTVVDPSNFINYITGDYTITFSQPPAASFAVNSQTVPIQLSRPQSMLYYGNKFTLRPVPDQAYRVNFDVYVRPTELIAAGQKPDLEQWWQYISYGASLKVVQDRRDMETVQMIMPEFKKQEALCLRTTIVQQTNEQTATIYNGNNGWGNGWGWNNGPF